MSRHEDPQISIREVNHIKAQNIQLGRENEPKSPNFKSVRESQGEYGFG
jgi:hypothetical protein